MKQTFNQGYRKYIFWAMFFCCIILKGNTPHVFHLDNKDGLSSNYVRHIAQDSRGFIWVATGDGINRFEGQRFVTYTKENSGLQSNQVNDIIPDPSNPDRMWFATRNDGIAMFDYSTGKVEACPDISSSPHIPSLSKASHGKIWITNYYDSPDLFDPKTGKTKRLYDKMPDGIPFPIWCLREVPSKELLYLGHDGGGLTIVDLKTKKFKNFIHSDYDKFSIIGNHIYSIFAEDDGTAWIGTDKGLSIYRINDNSFQNVVCDGSTNGLLGGAVYNISQMRNGDLWIATSQGGISILNQSNRLMGVLQFDNMLPPSNPESVSSSISTSSIFTLYEDSFGNKWVGNFYGGIDVFSYAHPFFLFERSYENNAFVKTHRSVWSTSVDNQGNLWIGGNDEFVKLRDNSSHRYSLPTISNGYNVQIKAMCADKNGNLWIGTDNSGLYLFNLIDESIRKILINASDIRDIIEDDDSMLIATNSGIFRSINGGVAYPCTILNNIIEDRIIMSLLKDSHDNLWIGSFGFGATMISRNGHVYHYDRDSGLGASTVNDFYEDTAGNVWVATRDGASRIDRESHKVTLYLGMSEGLKNSDIKAINGSIEGTIWLATNNGLVSYNPTTDNISTYLKTFGESLTLFTEKSSVTVSDNRICFGSINGLVCFDSSIMINDSLKCGVVLTGIKVYDNNQPNGNMKIEIPVKNDITLPYNMNTFSIVFSDPDITMAASSDYCYNMKGVDDLWTAVTYENEATYRNLKPGKYEFRVRHRLYGHEWSDPITLAYLTITPPIYLTWWAKLMYIFVVVLLILAIVYSYKRKLNLKQKLAIETENHKNSSRINEERLIFFTNITHELRTPLSLIIAPIEDLVNDNSLNSSQRKKLLTVRASSMRLLNLINGILEFRKTETRNRELKVVYGNLSDFVKGLGIKFKELNNNKKVTITIDINDTEAIYAYYDPEIIVSVVNNLMGNSIKYTNEGEIKLSLHIVVENNMKYIELSVSDTGMGISEEDLPHIFERYYQAQYNRKVSGTGIGLALTKNLVDLHEGTITVDSILGKGSKFTIRLGLDNNYNMVRQRETDDFISNGPNIDEMKDHEGDKLKVLLVEDDNDVREYIKQTLGDDFEVLEAQNGKVGFEMVKQNIPDIVVSDIMMPEMDGIELCNAIKNDFSVSHIPVILLTAKDTCLDKEAGYSMGADSYITKPFTANLLRIRINNIIETRHKLTIRMFDKEFEQNVEPSHMEDKKLDKLADGKCTLSPIDKKFIDKFRMVIEENLNTQDIDIPFMSEKMCISQSSLYRKVKGMTGTTPNELIIKIKIQKACQLLENGGATVSDIPYAVGFSNPTYFRKVFKKEVGVSPSEYLAKHAKNMKI